MTNRYHLDSYTQRAKKDRPNPKTYYALFDRNGNFGEPLAKTMSADTAQRIVDLLNADEKERLLDAEYRAWKAERDRMTFEGAPV